MSATGTAIVSARGLTKRFGSDQALRGLALDLRAGEILGFVGPNGAGKSTCLRILLGIVPRDAGDVTVFGLDPARDAVAIRKRSTYLPGETNVYSYMRGGEYLRFTLAFHARRRELPRDIADVFELPLRARVRTYSAGMKQKLALLATLQVDVELYVLDEPDRALDATTRLHLRELLRALSDEGRTVLLSSHHLSEIEALAHRTAFVLSGRRIAESVVAGAKQRLRTELRLRLSREIVWPAGASSIEPDGERCFRVRVDRDPLHWVSGLPDDAIDSLEYGTTRLEDLYRALLEADQARTEAGRT